MLRNLSRVSKMSSKKSKSKIIHNTDDGKKNSGRVSLPSPSLLSEYDNASYRTKMHPRELNVPLTPKGTDKLFDVLSPLQNSNKKFEDETTDNNEAKDKDISRRSRVFSEKKAFPDSSSSDKLSDIHSVHPSSELSDSLPARSQSPVRRSTSNTTSLTKTYLEALNSTAHVFRSLTLNPPIIVFLGLEQSGKTTIIHSLDGDYNKRSSNTTRCEVHFSRTLNCRILDSPGFSNIDGNLKNDALKNQIARAVKDFRVCIVVLLQVYRSTRWKRIPGWIQYSNGLCDKHPFFVVCDVSNLPDNYVCEDPVDHFECLKFKKKRYVRKEIEKFKQVLNNYLAVCGVPSASGNNKVTTIK